MVGDQRNSQIIVNLLVTDLPGCVKRNAKILVRLDNVFVGVGCSSPVGERVFHHRKNELPVSQNTVSDGKVTSVKNEAWHFQALGCPLSA